MKPEFEIADASPGDTEWCRLLSESADGWAFHHPVYHRLQTRYLTSTDAVLSIYRRGSGSIVAIAPFVSLDVRRGDGYARFYLSGLLDAQGVLHQPEESQTQRTRVLRAVVMHLAKLKRQGRHSSVFISIPPLSRSSVEHRSLTNINPLCLAGFTDRSRVNYIIDLRKDHSEIWRCVNRRYQSYIRRALDRFEVTMGSRSDLVPFHQLMAATVGAKGSAVQPLQFYEEVFDLFSPANLELLLVREDDRIAGGLLVVKYGNSVEYWAMAGAPDAKRRDVMKALFWTAIERAKLSGFEYFDCGEAEFDPRRTSLFGLSQFKRSFGGTPLNLHRGEYKL